MVVFREEIDSVLALRFRDVVHRLINITILLLFIVVSWRVFVNITKCPSSVVVVISGSMEPGYKRGDILFLHRRLEEHPIHTGDVVVYQVPGKSIPIVHRVLRLHRRERDHKTLILTKGDNNNFDDHFIYQEGQEWVGEEDVIGKSYAYIPRLGYVTLMLSEFPALRYVSLVLILFFLISLEE